VADGEKRPERECRDGEREYLDGRMIEPLELTGNENVADLIDRVYAASGFNARRLGEAARLYSRMLREDATVALTVAGAMTPIGIGVISSLIERGFIDFIISTGANVYHDLHRAYGMPMVQGRPEVDDNDLAERGVARIYDVFIHDEDTLHATDQAILKGIRDFDAKRPFSTAKLHQAIGRAVLDCAPHPEKSFLAMAATYDVPVYTSSPGDSSVGMNLIIPQLFDGPVHLNPLLDVIETAAIVRSAKKNGVVEIGGGSPKNFYLQTQPTLQQILLDKSKGGHDYFIQLTTDSPQWGGLSGATPSEARSWGKLKDAYRNNVVVYSCASVTFPLLAQYVLVRNEPREHKRLLPKIGEVVAELEAAARASELLQDQHPWLKIARPGSTARPEG
jgi:deoxyhypusine synthase